MSVGLRYGALVGCTLFVFTNFVACGAQMYQVSMRGDHDTTRAHPGSTDPRSPQFGLHAPNGWATLPIDFKVGNSMNPDQVTGLKNAIRSWELAVGKKLFRFSGVHGGVDGDSFPDLYSSLRDQINGEYIDADWDKTAKGSQVLATTIWNTSAADDFTIDTADIRYNSQHYILGDALTLRSSQTREVVDMESLALHELGHLLGLSHVPKSNDSSSIMNPQLFIGEGLVNRRLSSGDLRRVQQIYGCEGEACDITTTVMRISKLKGDHAEGERVVSSGVGSEGLDATNADDDN